MDSTSTQLYSLSEDQKVVLRERATKLSRVIEALESISSSEYWKLLEREVFEPELDVLRGKLAKEKDTVEVFRLQGQVTWGEKRLSLSKLITQYRLELSGIRRQLSYGT